MDHRAVTSPHLCPRLGSVSGALGLQKFLEDHDFVVTSSKDGPDSVFEKELPDADVVPWYALVGARDTQC